MESKKNEKINGARFRTMFRHIGFIIAISLTITAFEWKFEEVKIELKIPVDEGPEIIKVIVTTQPLPEPPKPVTNSTEIVEVSNDTEISTEIIEIVKPAPIISDDYIVDSFFLDDDVIVEPEIEIVHIRTEIDAIPIEGLTNWYKKVNEYCIDNFPTRDKGTTGKIYVSFIVEKDGSLSNFEIKKGISKRLDKLALDAVKNSGDWISAKQGGRKVRLIKNLPIKFN